MPGDEHEEEQRERAEEERQPEVAQPAVVEAQAQTKAMTATAIHMISRRRIAHGVRYCSIEITSDAEPDHDHADEAERGHEDEQDGGGRRAAPVGTHPTSLVRPRAASRWTDEPRAAHATAFVMTRNSP